jgi:hypothetical protein
MPVVAPSSAPAAEPLGAYGAPSLRVKRLDLHTRITVWMIQKGIQKWKSDPPGVARVRPPRLWGELPSRQLVFGSGGTRISLPVLDEDWPASDLKRRATLALLRSRLLPLRDRDDAWVNAEEARDTFQEVLPLGTYLTLPYHHWDEMRSDAAMSRLAFAGLGALRLLPFEPDAADPTFLARGAWVNDMTFLQGYEVREGFERYGAKAVFAHDQRPLAIYWCHGHTWVRPSEPGWEHAKWAWRCSLLVGSTLVDHLVGVHWTFANRVTAVSRTCLSRTHWLRLLLKPFTWRTVTINASATNTLCPERAFVHRATAFTYPALLRAFEDSVRLQRFRTVPELIARKGAAGLGDRFPWATDALALYEVIHAFVKDYVGSYADDDAILADREIEAMWISLQLAPPSVGFPPLSPASLVDVLAQFIWSATGLHEAVGTVCEYLLDPSFMGTKIRPGREMVDVQTSLQGFLVMALTGLEMPSLLDLGDAAHLFGADPRGPAAFRRFHHALVALSERIAAANRVRAADPDRPWPCRTFDPRSLEIGVGI